MRIRSISGLMARSVVPIDFGIGEFSLGANQEAVQYAELRIRRERCITSM